MNVRDRALHYKLYKTMGTTKLWQVKGARVASPFFYEAGVIIDFDGAPDAYAPRGSGLIGKDALGNAIAMTDKRGNSPWLSPPAKQTDPPTNPRWTPTYKSTVRDPRTGASVIQTSGPYAGYYISESSAKDYFHAVPGRTQTDPAYQTDANVYPYVVLPALALRDSGVQVCDYALAIHGQTGAYTFAIFGDAKNKHVMGESSSALAKALGLPYQRGQGTPSGVIYVVFPGSGLGRESRCPLALLPESGARWLRMHDDRLDLSTQVIQCFTPEYPGVKRAFSALGY